MNPHVRVRHVRAFAVNRLSYGESDRQVDPLDVDIQRDLAEFLDEFSVALQGEAKLREWMTWPQKCDVHCRLELMSEI
jgi:hypothetical protein